MKPLSLLLDFFLPSDCEICKMPLEYDEAYICKTCFSKVEEIKPPICRRCGRPSFSIFCLECRRKRRYFKRAMFCGTFSGVLKEAIHIFKYEKKQGLSNCLGNLMCRALDRTGWNFDVITAVPLHKKKEKARGFNQTRLLAEIISKKRNLPLFNGLKKRINTPSQVGLPYNERRANVIDCFTLKDKEKIKGKSILLIDDVMTTGTTIEECSKILLEGGA
ncbi:MAG: ComF family protein, partial [bacterium]